MTHVIVVGSLADVKRNTGVNYSLYLKMLGGLTGGGDGGPMYGELVRCAVAV